MRVKQIVSVLCIVMMLIFMVGCNKKGGEKWHCIIIITICIAVVSMGTGVIGGLITGAQQVSYYTNSNFYGCPVSKKVNKLVLRKIRKEKVC